jgi:Asp-tRNA(Asn)/Glu-tRNA(Gln) amidotransferase A subunit family amidase
MNHAGVPRSENPLTLLSATALAKKIRLREVTSREVVEAHIRRIEEVNPTINALVTDTFEAARKQADDADKALAKTDGNGKGNSALGPLHGVPFSAKDSIDVGGVRSTCGLWSRRDNVPAKDATVVRRMRDAGAILLGKTNTPDACWAQETNNPVFGRTNNPWDTSRTVGGSTGGEAALLAAKGSPIGIGTDIAGSIRMPAHFTGIVGFRPTSDSLDESGLWPELGARSTKLESVGPMARTVEDVALGWDILRGATPEPIDTARIAGQRVAHWFGDGMSKADPAIRQGVSRAVEALTTAGMVRVEGKPKDIRLAILGWAAYQLADDRDELARSIGGGEKWSPWSELKNRWSGKPRVSREALEYWLASHVGSVLGEKVLHKDGADKREAILEQLHALIGDDGVAVCPIHPTVAQTHGWSSRRLAMFTTITYQAWVNLAGIPGISVPAGWQDGLPYSVQLVTMPGREKQLLAAAAVVEEALRTEDRSADVGGLR